MKRWWLDITLNSDTCVATGDSENGAADLKTALEHGLPVIPSKRLKGCLLNEGKEMVSNGLAGRQCLAGLFGEPGGRAGSLRIGDAHIYRIPASLLRGSAHHGDLVIENYDKELKCIRNNTQLRPETIERFMTRVRTRTAMDKESGAAQDSTLRSIQVIPRGVVFRSSLLLNGPENGEEIKLLNWCVKAMRHIGMGITRGYGEVSLKLTEDKSRESDGIRSSMPAGQREDELNYTIELLNPVLFSGSGGAYGDCGDFIPGSSVMGALAAMYIEDYGLGEHAGQDENFRRIFLADGVKFGNGFLFRDGERFYPCPAFLASEKTDDNNILNLLKEEDRSVRRKEINRQIRLDWTSQTVCQADVQKEVRMHHARPKDRGIGHAVNDRFEAGAKDMGQFFQYTSLSRSQMFSGVIKGKKEDLQAILKCLERRKGRLYLGRSRTAEYGEVRVSCCAGSEREALRPSKEWVLWLVSPMVFCSCGNFMIESEPEAWSRQLTERLGCGVKVIAEDSILRYTKIGGYNSKWRLPLPQYMALAPGSAVCIEAEREIEANELEQEFWGDMTGRGYGQVLALPREIRKDTIKLKKAVETGQKPAVNKMYEKSELEKVLLDMAEKREKIAADCQQALDEKVTLSNTSTLQKLIKLAEKGDGCTYEEMVGLLEKIKDETKKKSAIEAIEPCKDKSKEFIKFFLTGSKYKLREGKGSSEDK